MYNRNNLLYLIASAYYIERKSKSQIASEFNISRPTVNTLLDEALQDGTVTISIHPKPHDQIKLSEHIKDKFNLKYVSITDSASDYRITKTNVARNLVNFIEENAYRLKTIGLGWGTTLKEFVDQANFIDLHHLTIIPMMGGANTEYAYLHSNQLCFSLAEKFNANTSFFYAPAICDSIHLKMELEASYHVREAKQRAKLVDMAIISIGNPNKSSTYKLLGNVIKSDEINPLDDIAYGDILASFFDKNGMIVSTGLSKKMIGITLEDLEYMKEITIIASGMNKAESLFYLLKKGFIDNIIIDSEIANFLYDVHY
ncbi:hypothetical protein HMPREF9318_01899 [Streptococcus urinalis FB127-CNA-2]|uniref:Sugar-binding domain protein n=1 Tax=Streptococcus urinalis 2285-97 TaxID=764291 RepID=G5KDD5_9STRE|nr:sugar-binding domain-containing protein [Streptococcus urinalis]EHJ57520.1 sugar-binding domain protein [Streptococcus urinalis 2285-97]EKS17450.1 hypothetical protein HMPREF9318_01899 [Streptococcus urinalis FB127-CNA-2]VEF32728.1 sugar-binding regulatory protein [Streptococcus urinalis]